MTSDHAAETGPPAAHLAFERLHNFRDLGGLTATDGRTARTVRTGMLYRSDSLGKLAGGDWERFLELGIRTVVDLRYPWEIDRKGRVPEHPSFGYHNFSIEHRPYNQAALGPEIDTGRYLAERYAEVAHDGAAEIRSTLHTIADAEGPVVFHCTSGKDRTGLIAALVLDLLGVSEADIVEDFTRTEHASARLIADWWAEYAEHAPLWPGYGRAPAAVMRLFLAGLSERYGSVRGYTTHVLGTPAATDVMSRTLRERLLSPSFQALAPPFDQA